MAKIRVLSDHVANQIAAGEVVERPASVAKELVENAIDAGARRIEVDTEAGGRRLLRVADDGEGMTRDDALLAFERHATSKISSTDDLTRIATLGFRGEALASIASVARVELLTGVEGEAEGTRVLIEGGRMRDVQPAARPCGTTITVRDLFFNIPARRKFLRSEATESYHLTNFVTHYALAHPEIEFVLTNNGRETLRVARAADLRERAYQIFGADFLDSLLEVRVAHEGIATVRGYISAPRERRTSRDAQYLFVNGRFVRDRLISRALGEGYRAVLPQGTYPAALLFLETPLEEVDVNVHPAKTEVRFRRAAAVSDAVREAIRAALAAGGYVRPQWAGVERDADISGTGVGNPQAGPPASHWSLDDGSRAPSSANFGQGESWQGEEKWNAARLQEIASRQEAIAFGVPSPEDDPLLSREATIAPQGSEAASSSAAPPGNSPGDAESDAAIESFAREMTARADAERNWPGKESLTTPTEPAGQGTNLPADTTNEARPAEPLSATAARAGGQLPPLKSAAGLVREVSPTSLTANIRPLGQFAESFIIASDPDGLLLIDQHVAHERILFDKYRRQEGARAADSQQLLVPETFDLTPAQAAAFDAVADELEAYGFSLMRLSGRTVAIKAVPADLPANEARNLLAEVLDSVEAEKRGAARAGLRDAIAVSLSCRAAIKSNTPLSTEKMQWLIDRLLQTSSPTTCPHGRPIILRLATRDVMRGFQRT
ncbi:MAG: DNA mismatch repair endonuclease MutL [Pyrinomonadaceae bacterium]